MNSNEPALNQPSNDQVEEIRRSRAELRRIFQKRRRAKKIERASSPLPRRVVSEDCSGSDKAAQPSGDQVEEIYAAIAELKHIYARRRHADEDAGGIPANVRSVMKKLRDFP
jgi:hypothetical protein